MTWHRRSNGFGLLVTLVFWDRIQFNVSYLVAGNTSFLSNHPDGYTAALLDRGGMTVSGTPSTIQTPPGN